MSMRKSNLVSAMRNIARELTSLCGQVIVESITDDTDSRYEALASKYSEAQDRIRSLEDEVRRLREANSTDASAR